MKLNLEVESVFNKSEARGEGSSMCVACKGSRMLCGKTRCPIVVKHYVRMKTMPLIDSFNIDGSSPPSVFVGRFGYPKVQVGPLIPPIHGDTSLMDMPEEWLQKSISIDDIVNFRFQLIRGKHPVHVKNVEDGGRIVDNTREIAMANNPADVEAEFERKPYGRVVLDDEVQPFGPSAPLKKIDVSSMKIDQRIDKAYSDDDLLSKEAVIGLYKNEVPITKIQRSFSVGAFGLGKNRKFVPTRWSITAVDDTIGKELRERTKDHPLINEFRIYESWKLDNRFIIMLMPFSWRYELIEAWYPNTVWNPMGKRIVLFSDHEKYMGRTTYAQIGGCYYAARFAVGEFLCRIRRQAATVILREAHPGYIMPVGVWNVRENVRNAFQHDCRKFNTLKESFSYISSRLEIPVKKWISHSAILKDLLYQKRIEDFLT
jgi:hypothetical protein